MSWRKLLYQLGLFLGLLLFGYQLWQALWALVEHPGAISAPAYLIAAVFVWPQRKLARAICCLSYPDTCRGACGAISAAVNGLPNQLVFPIAGLV